MTQRFDIWVAEDPQAMLRVIGLFAQRSLVPERLVMEREGACLRLSLEIAALDARGADILVARLRESVMVIDAVRREGAPALIVDGLVPVAEPA